MLPISRTLMTLLWLTIRESSTLIVGHLNSLAGLFCQALVRQKILPQRQQEPRSAPQWHAITEDQNPKDTNMTSPAAASTKTRQTQSAGRGYRRSKRSVRFSDYEWEQVQKAAAERAITPSEYVRNAALNAVDGATSADIAALSPALVEIIKLTHRSAYILSTLKRDEMIRDGRAREMDEMVRAARNAQADILRTFPSPGGTSLT